MSASISRALVSSLLSAALVSTTGGCAAVMGSQGATAFGSAAAVDLSRPELQGFAVASMTDLERDVRIETGQRDAKPVTPVLFWTGIGVGSIMAAGSIGFGVAGFVTKNRLNDGYTGETPLSLEERDQLVSRGGAYNSVAATTAAFAALGFALALVSYGVDWNRCGPLATGKNDKKKRRCDQARPR